jgi:hypothetical protein
MLQLQATFSISLHAPFSCNIDRISGQGNISIIVSVAVKNNKSKLLFV